MKALPFEPLTDFATETVPAAVLRDPRSTWRMSD
jgi:hypothetical protein